jgi:hypothetical protein
MFPKNLFLILTGATLLAAAVIGSIAVQAQSTIPVDQDPDVRMPGTQPKQVSLEDSRRCMNCHAGYNSAVEPGFNWQGSMMAQASRDFLFWATFTVAAQDAHFATNSFNAVDLCERCHFPKGWLEGRSDPPNASAMTGADYDGVSCDFCHRMYDPFFETVNQGVREGNDWLNYWDETNLSQTPSGQAAAQTYSADVLNAGLVKLFNGSPFFVNNKPFSSLYTEAAGGQFFITNDSNKRASFADAQARHRMDYSRFHKSKYFCASCHDVSNSVLANIGANPTEPLPSELYSAFSYFHVERTFSEFMLSAYGQQGGSPGIGPFSPSVFETSLGSNYIARCQDCHMRDVLGRGADKKDAVLRKDESIEHPQSGQPLHDLTGGNIWVPSILASTVSGSPNYDPTNASLLRQGANVLTLDLNQGMGLEPAALLAGVDRSIQQLELAASIEGLNYNSSTGQLQFRVQNQTGHKLISGYPEGRRMYVNIRAYNNGVLIHEVNPYDAVAATLKGLTYTYQPDPLGQLPLPSGLASHETHVDALVYEMKGSSSISGEAQTFHFILVTDRYKDNRIPPKGFDISRAQDRLAHPRWAGADALNYFSSAEYAGGYHQVSLPIAPGADYVEVNLYYQTTSREYNEFLRDEINASPANRTLPSEAYIAQTDPFFAKLKAWGDTMWSLWHHNRDLPGAAPVLMTSTAWGQAPDPGCTAPGVPQNLAASGGNRRVDLSWISGAPGPDGGYNLYYDQAGKLQYIDSVNAGTLKYTDNKLKQKTQYCYVITAWNDCNGNGIYDPGIDMESMPTSPPVCATTR